MSFQELKNLLLEAQKGPESLQEALKVQAGNHRSQQDELRSLIDSLRVALADVFTRRDGIPPQRSGSSAGPPAAPPSALRDLSVSSQRSLSLLESLPPQLAQLERGLVRAQSDLSAVRNLLETRPHMEPRTDVQAAGVQLQGEEQREAVGRNLAETQRMLGEKIRTNTFYNAVFTYTASALTVSAVYLLLRGT